MKGIAMATVMIVAIMPATIEQGIRTRKKAVL